MYRVNLRDNLKCNESKLQNNSTVEIFKKSRECGWFREYGWLWVSVGGIGRVWFVWQECVWYRKSVCGIGRVCVL
jgi:hypothetical protein